MRWLVQRATCSRMGIGRWLRLVAFDLDAMPKRTGCLATMVLRYALDCGCVDM
jgi:hypothetical protein